MYSALKIFAQPEDENSKIWRYMDISKFITVLDSNALFFTRADKLGDPFEGSYPRKNIEARNFVLSDNGLIPRPKYFPKDTEAENWKRYYGINCWHMNEHESAAMWKLYLSSNEGIAIQSTYSRLKESLIDKYPIHLGLVKYIDYENDYFESGNYLLPFLHKRKSFEHEKEVRAVVQGQIPIKNKNHIDFSIDTIDNGISINVDLKVLIERIHISPTSPDWFKKVVSTVVDRFNFNFEVKKSRLNEDPFY